MKRLNKQTGGKGEREAKKLLHGKGYKILKMNWGNKWGEIDTVCLDGETVVFVEVKAKTGDGYGAPWQMVNRRKLDQVRRMGELFLSERGWQDKSCRIDVVGVVFDRSGKVINTDHYENVY
jgi:putative endonuclease